MTQRTQGSSSFFRVWADNPYAAAMAVAIVALVVATMACARRQEFLAGDEAPIRVRNGSIELQLLHGSQEWESVNDRKNWKVKNEPQRQRDAYEVTVAPSDASSCTNGVFVATGDTVEITTSAGSIQLKLTGRKTRVRSSDVDLEGRGSLLRDPAQGSHIRKIVVGDLACTFDSKDEKLRVIIMDP